MPSAHDARRPKKPTQKQRAPHAYCTRRTFPPALLLPHKFRIIRLKSSRNETKYTIGALCWRRMGDRSIQGRTADEPALEASGPPRRTGFRASRQILLDRSGRGRETRPDDGLCDMAFSTFSGNAGRPRDRAVFVPAACAKMQRCDQTPIALTQNSYIMAGDCQFASVRSKTPPDPGFAPAAVGTIGDMRC